MYFNYTHNIDLYVSLVGSIFFSVALGGIGLSILKLFKIDKLISSVPMLFHSVLIGFTCVSIIIQWTLYFKFYTQSFYKALGVSIFILGTSLLVFFLRTYSLKIEINYRNLFLLILFFLIALAPITSADALHYHLGVPLSILKLETNFFHKEWFHFGLAGISEGFNLLVLSLNLEQLPNLLQFFSILSIVGLFYEVSSKNRNILLTFFLTTPVIIFLATAAKPQLNGIALTSFAFSLVLAQKLNIRQFKVSQIIFLLFILISAAAVKLNFYLSAFIIFIVFLVENRKYLDRRLILKITAISAGVLFIVLFPNFYLKFQNGYSLINLLLPLDPEQPGSEEFYEYLRNYRDSVITFPLSLFIPSGIGNVTMILGLNLVILLIVLFKCKLRNKKYLFYIGVFLILSWILGQNTARFYLEPYVWTILFFNYFLLDDLSNKSLIKMSLNASYLSIVMILIFGIFTLLRGSFSIKNRENLLIKNADGYVLSKWVNKIIPKDKSIILEHSSISFFNQNVYSSDWVDSSIDNDDFYLNYLNNVDYIVVVDQESPNKSYLFKYCGDLISGPFKFKRATRNPFNSGKEYKAWIFKASLSK